MSKTVVASGYFIILHIGHIEYFKLAKALGDKLVVILNNDQQQILKYGRIIVPFKQRKAVLEAIKYIDVVVESIDSDRSVCKTLEQLQPEIFAKGGDRFINEIPEKEVCDKLGIRIIDGLGNKIQSSSDLMNKIKRVKQI
jgi:cytidyltransferase-like protein